MSATIINGKEIAQKIRDKLKQQISSEHLCPALAVILVGDNPASLNYIEHKQNACQEIGIHSKLHHLNSNTTAEQLYELINSLNNDIKTDGILLQLPLPEQLDAQNFLEEISPSKDVDGFHPYNIGRLTQRAPTLRPATPFGIILMLQNCNINITGKNVVIVGASNIVGRPLALEMLLERATVSVCHRFTTNLEQHIKNADILVAALGKPGVINSAWIKPGAIVIDVGFTIIDGKIHGDIDFASAAKKASFITPVPGGVGPMTIAALMLNTVQAHKQKLDLPPAKQ